MDDETISIIIDQTIAGAIAVCFVQLVPSSPGVTIIRLSSEISCETDLLETILLNGDVSLRY